MLDHHYPDPRHAYYFFPFFFFTLFLFAGFFLLQSVRNALCKLIYCYNLVYKFKLNQVQRVFIRDFVVAILFYFTVVDIEIEAMIG